MGKKKTKKKKLPEKTNYILKWLYTFLAIIIIILTYKCILISIANRKSDADDFFKDRTVTGYAADISITHEEREEAVNYVGLRIENVFKNFDKEDFNDDTVVFKEIDGDKEASIHRDVTIINNYELEDIEDYMESAGIENDDDIYDFIINYKRKKLDIFDSFKTIRNEMFKFGFFTIAYHSFDEIHKVTGDYNGRVKILNDTIYYELYFGDTMYILRFKGYDIDTTTNIISSIGYNEVTSDNTKRGYYVKKEDNKEFLYITSGEKPNGCYDIKLVETKYDKNTFKVVVEEINEAKNDPNVMCTMALTYPTIKTEITKSYKNIEVTDVNGEKFAKLY